MLANRLSFNDYVVSDWKLENETMINALRVEQTVMFLILSLFVSVAMLSIFSNLLLMVNEKQKSIAILRSMGVSSNDIGKIFFLTGFLVALVGTLCGVCLGVSFSMNIQKIKTFLEAFTGVSLFNPAVYFLDNLPAIVRSEDVLRIFGNSMILAVIASVIPARKVSKQKPAEVLKQF
jgi:lipoprotein-releasing system permease protein